MTVPYKEVIMMPLYARIPDPRMWEGYFDPEWMKIAEAICPYCNLPIGYDALAKAYESGWGHYVCPAKLEQIEQEKLP